MTYQLYHKKAVGSVVSYKSTNFKYSIVMIYMVQRLFEIESILLPLTTKKMQVWSAPRLKKFFLEVFPIKSTFFLWGVCSRCCDMCFVSVCIGVEDVACKCLQGIVWSQNT